MIELLKELCALDGISGYEAPVSARIRELAAPFADEIRTDVLGNLYVFKRGEQRPAAPVAVTTPMGEYGFVLSEHGELGAMKLTWVDEMDARNVIGKRYRVAGSGRRGVISLVAQHLTGRTGTDSVPELKELQFDCGTSARAETEKLLRLGDTIVFDYPVVPFGENCLRGKAIDCRVGCAVLVRLIREVKPKFDTWFVFTAATGLEHRGAEIAAREIDPAVCLSVTACACCDVPMQKPERVSVRLRQGAAVGIKERRILYSRRLNRLLCTRADAAGIPWQYRAAVSDTSDAGTLQISASGMEVMGLSVPVRGMSSANPVVYIPDMEATYAFASLFVREVEEHDA